jgi:transcription initiation factor TFIIB
MSYGKDPKALSVAVLYAACQKRGEKISQKTLAETGNTSLVTLRKRFLDVQKVIAAIPNRLG